MGVMMEGKGIKIGGRGEGGDSEGAGEDRMTRFIYGEGGYLWGMTEGKSTNL